MTDWIRVLRAIAPQGRADIVAAIAAHADEMFRRYRIDTALRQAHFLAHVAVESGYLTRLEEDLSYSAKRLHDVWTKRFPTIASAEPFSHNPRKLAEKVYGGRMGNNQPGDGFMFRGHGLLQETGRENTTELARHLGISVEQTLQWLVDPAHITECACARFVMNGCLPYADRDDIRGTTLAINGGDNGLAERQAALRVAKRMLAAVTPSPFGSMARVGFLNADDGPAIEGDDVRNAQRKLKDLGFFPGAIDGDLGESTRAAIDAFQRRNGLPITGDIDEATKSALGSGMARGRSIGAQRAQATIDDLRDEGSETIEAADDASSGVSASKMAAGGAGGLAVLGTVSEGVSKVKSAQDTASLLPDMWEWTQAHWPLALLLAVIVVLWWKHRKIERSLQRIRNRRLDDHRTFRHAGR